MLTSPKLIEPVQMARGIPFEFPVAGRAKPRRRPTRTSPLDLTASERRLEVETLIPFRRAWMWTVAIGMVALAAAIVAGRTAASPRDHGDREFVQHNLV